MSFAKRKPDPQKEHKKHHIVPVCYLRNFSVDEVAWVYNKKVGKPYQKNVNDIFFIPYFYSIDDKYIPDIAKAIMHPLSIEYDYFAQEIESQFDNFYTIFIPFIEKLINDNQYKEAMLLLPEDYVENIAFQIAVQYLRTPEARFNVMKFMAAFKASLRYCKNNNIPIEEFSDTEILDFLNSEYGAVLNHFLVCFNPKLLKTIVDKLRKKVWSVYINTTKNEHFFTSDSPVILERKEPSNHNFWDIDEEGLIISYPVTDKVLVRLWDRDFYKDFIPFDRMFRYIDNNLKDFIKIENSYMYCWGNEIVSPSDEIKQLQFIRQKLGKEQFYRH